MKSKLISLYNYALLLFEPVEEICPIEVLDHEIQNDLESLRLQNTFLANVVTVASGDIVSVSLDSTDSRYQKPSLSLNVGLGLFQPQLEAALIGRNVGETFSMDITDAHITVIIQSCKHQTIPDNVTDAMVCSLGIPNVSSCAEYRVYMKDQYKQQYHKWYTSWYANAFLKDLCLHSTWQLNQAEVEDWYQRWHAARDEELKAHDTFIGENYPGEREKMERDDALKYLQIYLIDCLFSGKNPKQSDLDLRDAQALTQVQNRVLKPLEEYLSDKVVIKIKEED